VTLPAQWIQMVSKKYLIPTTRRTFYVFFYKVLKQKLVFNTRAHLLAVVFLKKILLLIYSHVCTLFGSFLPPLPYPPRFQAEPSLPLFLILLKRRHKHNKEDKAFLLVKNSYTERFLALLSCTNVLQSKLTHL
jgi:hypothetical protein